MASTNVQEKANLARIRDNQRRSRARRKEYLQDLETRMRSCELEGVEASAEIQAAARKVADENKRLRSLLKSRGGLSDAEIDDFLINNEGLPPSAPVLDKLLCTRKPCKSGRGCGSSSCSEISSPWEQTPTSGTSSTVPIARAGSQQQHQQQQQQQQHQQQQQLGIMPKPTGYAASSASSSQLTSRSGSHPYIAQHHQSHDQLFDFGDFHHAELPYHHPPTLSSSSNIHQHRGPRDGRRASSTSASQASTAAGTTTSCLFGASLITEMDTNVSSEEVTAAMGCAPGTDCEVDNSTLFSVMDRYTGDSLTL